jgi:uncharacterized protein (DUF433 family)
MYTIHVSENTYKWLKNKASKNAKTPDQVADELLQQQLAPKHAYIEVVERSGGLEAIIKGTNVHVAFIIGYLRIGETPETIASEIIPHLTLAQVYDAISYYHDYPEEIELSLAQNTEEYSRAYLREHLGEEDYLRLTGQLQ